MIYFIYLNVASALVMLGLLHADRFMHPEKTETQLFLSNLSIIFALMCNLAVVLIYFRKKSK